MQVQATQKQISQIVGHKLQTILKILEGYIKALEIVIQSETKK